jgi:hypothetical protein
MRLVPNKWVGDHIVSSWYFGCDSDGEAYGVAVCYAKDAWNPGVTYSYREFWV